jgi:hypothetical protein
MRALSLCLYRLSMASAILFATGAAAPVPAPPLPARQSYAEMARLYLASPIIVRAQVRNESKLSKAEAALLAPVPAGQARQWLTVDLQSALKAPDMMPARVRFLWQGELAANGKPPKLKKQSMLLFLRQVETAGDNPSFGLTEIGAALPWTDGDEAHLRSVALEYGLSVKGMRQVFVTLSDGDTSARFVHFLFETRNGAPLVAIVEEQGQQWQMRTTTTDLDQDAQAVKPETLLWYHLACGLDLQAPDAVRRLPDRDERAFAERAWQAMHNLLGPCTARK